MLYSVASPSICAIIYKSLKFKLGQRTFQQILILIIRK